MFQDTSFKVRAAISWVIYKICSHHADVMTGSPELTNIFVNVLIASLQDKPRVSSKSCSSIEKLAESLAPENPEVKNNALTPHFETIAKALMTNAGRLDTDEARHNLVTSSYAALISLCQTSCRDSDPSL